ncbi:unnamed protein product [Natator depressus]
MGNTLNTVSGAGCTSQTALGGGSEWGVLISCLLQYHQGPGHEQSHCPVNCQPLCTRPLPDGGTSHSVRTAFSAPLPRVCGARAQPGRLLSRRPRVTTTPDSVTCQADAGAGGVTRWQGGQRLLSMMPLSEKKVLL